MEANILIDSNKFVKRSSIEIKFYLMPSLVIIYKKKKYW